MCYILPLKRRILSYNLKAKKETRRMKKERIEEGKKEKGAKNGGFGIKCLLAEIIIPSGSSILPEPLPVQLQELKDVPC